MQPKNISWYALSAALLLVAAPSVAQRVPDDGVDIPQEKPWSKGVPLEARAAASDLFQEGRKLYRESLFVLAADQYRAALARCNCHHPAIHYNLMLSLVNLDRPIEMYENLIASMDNGLSILSKERFEQAKNFKVLLEKQLVQLHLRCDVPGAQVTFDGRPLLTPPGEFRGMVRPGMHTILATKDGLVTNEVIRQLDGGQKVALTLDLRTEEELTEYRRLWPTWKPWALVGAGAAIALAGGGLQYAAVKKARAADSSVVACSGCGPRPDLVEASGRAATMEKIAIAGYAAGGAALATGAILAYVNRAKAQVRHYDVDTPAAQEPRVAVAPVLDPHSPGVMAQAQF